MSNEIKKIEQPQIQWPAISDKEALTAALAPATVRRALRKVDTPMKAYQSEAPALASIAREHGEAFCKNQVASLFSELNDYLGSQCDLTPRQWQLLINDIYDNYYAINIADVHLVIKRIEHGECGKIYGKINPAYIFQAFADYYQERSDVVMESHKASEESIAKHGYDRSKANVLTDEEVEAIYEDWNMELEATLEKQRLKDLDRQYRLADFTKKIKRYQKNGTDKKKNLP